MIRYIVFDTETTGLDPFAGDKIIEIGCVEMFDKIITGKTYHQYVNPEKQLSQEIIDITHITDEELKDKPVFKDLAQDFLNFISEKPAGSDKNVLVAHNASFDIKFLNHELKTTGVNNLSSFEVIDTLDIARRKFPNQKATLDMLCEKFGISLEERRKEGHGALLDAKILADVFIKLIEGGQSLDINKDDNIDFIGFKKRTEVLQARKIYELAEQEKQARQKFLEDNQLADF